MIQAQTVRQVLQMLTADKKKLSLMVGLLAVGLLMWGRLLLKEVPRTATASGLASAVASAAETDKARRFIPKDAVTIIRPPQPARDVFAFDAKAYPIIVQPEPVKSRSKAEKSAPKTADVPDVVAVVKSQSAKLKLQTTMLGDSPRAMINGVLLAPGEKIDGFELIEVTGRQAVMVKDGVVIRLEL